MKTYHNKIPAYLPSLVVVGLLYYFTLTPQPIPPMDLPDIGFDKIVHVVMMVGVYLTFAFDYLRQKRQLLLSLSVKLWLLVITIAIGGAIELAQGTELINRGCDLYDFIADSVGSVVATIIAPSVMRRLL